MLVAISYIPCGPSRRGYVVLVDTWFLVRETTAVKRDNRWLERLVVAGQPVVGLNNAYFVDDGW